jgi:adsorption protein B
MNTGWQILLAQHHVQLEWAAAIVAVLIMISSIDDLFIDCWFWLNTLSRRLTIKRRKDYQPLTAEQLQGHAEQPFAIMVPAWLEYDVMAQMLESMVNTLDYRNYRIFVGTYPNDARTIAEVERMRARMPIVERVEVPHDGPTCKADCLNWLIQAIVLHEQRRGEKFAAVVLHDSEDVLHPLELKFFNYLVPRKDMIQLPVVSLEREWGELIAGTYMDEFAEWHAKDLVVREGVTGVVPSAGVGTCFSRRAIQALLDDTHNEPFNTKSLTEDYDVGSRLGKLGMRSIFAIFPVEFSVRRKRLFGSKEVALTTITMPLCVREFFPGTLRTAYRQKARWVLGIGLQSWEQIGWAGSLATKYLLFRDRKGIVTSFLAIIAYLLVIDFVVLWLLQHFGVTNMRFPPLLSTQTWLVPVLIFNLCSLILRVSQRIYFVNRLYGWVQALISVPRMVIGNYLNFLATARAWRMFLGYLFLGHALVWDKTMHDFPSVEQIAHTRQRLGDLLTAWRALTTERLDAALAEQDHRDDRQRSLGSILLSHGWLDDETLAEALSYQAGLPRSHPDSAEVHRNAYRLPAELGIRWRAVALDDAADGTPRIAVASPLPAEALDQLSRGMGAPVLQTVARESEIVGALRMLHGGAQLPLHAPLLGDVMVERGLVSRVAFHAALDRYRPDRDGRVGDYLVGLGVVTRAAVEEGIAAQRRDIASVTPSLETRGGPELVPV